MFQIIVAALVLGTVNAINWNVVIRRCLDLSGYSFKEACADMQIDEAQFSHQLNGEGHLSLKRLGRLHPRFHRWFAVVLAQHVGVPEEITVARQIDEIAAVINERLAL